VNARPPHEGHEPDTTSPAGVLLAVVVVGVVLAAALLVGRAWVWPSPAAMAGAADGAAAGEFAQARAWVRRSELRQRVQAEAARLHTYGWVDREADVIHVPVARAIELLAAEGLRVAPAPEEGER